ncbi:sigma-70 family RNA polymerase sigma factor [Nocardioides sp.]|uniref:RNA polymerase sigma factor n=1 Tax=Nocardioides sp. TaxID=35761 RepID=UPI002CD6C643|nr:sigma-70 family RNA polymerase sigma factor [Nocardioides sp.]HVX53813.1 sigma-70 family RNA polymerase sigma factor [Nocardioides sp.]
MSTAEFPELLREAQQGDERAFNALFRQNQPVVLKYLMTVAGREAAEDIAADTWVSVVRDLGRFEGDEPAAFRAWLLSIARRRWIDEVRRRTRRPETPVDVLPELTPAPDDVVSASDAAAGTRWALDLLATLPPDQAEILALRVIADLDVHTTAKLVGKTPGAVRVTAHRALRRLAGQLGGDQSDPAVTNPAAPTIDT